MSNSAVTPIKKGTARRLGLRESPSAAAISFAERIGYRLEPWQKYFPVSMHRP